MSVGGGRSGRASIVALAAAMSLAALFPLTAQTAESSGNAALTLTVAQAIERTMANQPLIQQAEAAVEAARARVGEAESAYYPNVNAAATYTRVEPDQSFTFPGLGTFSLAPVDNWDIHLGLNQIIYQFGRREAQVRLARTGVTAARIGVEQTRTALAFQAAQVYFTALFLREQGKALNAELENLQEHLKVTQIKEQTGSATELEVLGTQVRLAALESQRTDVEGQFQKQMIALRQLTGLESGQDITLGSGFASGEPPGDVQSLLASALHRRPDVRQAVEAENAAELSRQLALTAAYPTISARGTLGYKTGEMPDINQLSFNWNAGVQVSVPLFQGFLVTRSVDEAEKKLLAAKESTSAAKRTVTTQVLQAFQDVQSARQQVAISAAALDQARQMVEVAKVQYDIGVITNLEYLDSQTGRETANISHLSAMYREVLSEYALRQAVGETLGETAGPSAAR